MGTSTARKLVFVTVGTTRFDALIEAISTPDALECLAAQGFTDLLIQIGASPEPTVGTAAGSDYVREVQDNKDTETKKGVPESRLTSLLRRRVAKKSTSGQIRGNEAVSVSWYRYKDSLRADMEAADVIISHAGAGSVMEGLNLGKALLVVVNTALMDDHQQELAHAMQKKGYLVATEPNGVVGMLQNYHQWQRSLILRPSPTPGLIPALLDQEMGFSSPDPVGTRGVIMKNEEEKGNQ